MKKSILIILGLFLMAGCGKEETVVQDNQKENISTALAGEVTNQDTASEGYLFTCQETVIPMNADATPILAKLGKPTDYFEAASCAFQGLDKIYYYQGFELGTYPNGGKDYVSYVNLMDDSVETDEGLTLGSTKEDMLLTYGEGYRMEGSTYTYLLGNSKLTFLLEQDSIIQITYSAILEEDGEE